MGDPFICNKCGAPRKYINQFCPDCFSTGPHLAAPKDKTRPSLPSFRKKPPEKDFYDDDFKPRKHTTKEGKRTESDTFAEEFNYGRPRRESTWAVKEPKQVKEPKPRKERRPKNERPSQAEVEIERFEKISVEEKHRPAGKSIIRLPALYLALFAVIAIPVVWLVINSLNSGNSNPDRPVTTTSNQNPVQSNTPIATSGNSTQPAQTTPVVTSPDNPSKPAPPVTPRDTTPPKLAGSQPEIIAADTTATLAWKTDEKSKSTVRYGTTRSVDFFGAEESVFKTEHISFITSLTPDTVYYFNITAVDEAGNSGPVTDGTFRTLPLSNTAPYVGSRAPDFSLKTLDGKDVSLSQYRGSKVILNFWASWCSPCKIELPHMQKICDKYQNGNEVVVLTVAGAESDENEIKSFIYNNNYSFIVGLDSTESTFNRYDITSVPKTFFLDKNGIIKKVQLGMFTSPGEIEFILTSY